MIRFAICRSRDTVAGSSDAHAHGSDNPRAARPRHDAAAARADRPRTLPGRLVRALGRAAGRVVVAQRFVALPDVVEIFRKVVSLAFLGSASWLVGRRHRAQPAPAALARPAQADPVVRVPRASCRSCSSSRSRWPAAVVLYTNVAAYMFHDGLDGPHRRRPADRRHVGERDRPQPGDRRRRRSTRKYANLDGAVSGALAGGRADAERDGRADRRRRRRAVAARRRRRRRVPAWVARRADFDGRRRAAPSTDAAARCRAWSIRAAVADADGSDRVVDRGSAGRHRHRRAAARATGTRIDGITDQRRRGGRAAPAGSRTRRRRCWPAFRQTVAFMDCHRLGRRAQPGRVAIGLDAPARRVSTAGLPRRSRQRRLGRAVDAGFSACSSCSACCS